MYKDGGAGRHRRNKAKGAGLNGMYKDEGAGRGDMYKDGGAGCHRRNKAEGAGHSSMYEDEGAGRHGRNKEHNRSDRDQVWPGTCGTARTRNVRHIMMEGSMTRTRVQGIMG